MQLGRRLHDDLAVLAVFSVFIRSVLQNLFEERDGGKEFVRVRRRLICHGTQQWPLRNYSALQKMVTKSLTTGPLSHWTETCRRRGEGWVRVETDHP